MTGNFIWRFIATGILYIVFGVGALFLAISLVPLAVVVSPNKSLRAKRVRSINRLAFRTFVRCGVWCGVFDFNIQNSDYLQQTGGQIIIANHPSLLDVVFLLGHIPDANCIVKKALLRNPFLALQVYFADYILNDEGPDLLESCQKILERGQSVIIFPEGTRTRRSTELNFKRGAAYLMIMSKSKIRPVHISCYPAAMAKTDPWYRVPAEKIKYEITAMKSIDIQSLRDCDSMGLPLKSRRLTRYLIDLYHQMNRKGPSTIGPYPEIASVLEHRPRV